MSDRDFGGLVREARDRLGMSHNRVADLVGRSPSTVKAWERGRSVPSEANVVSSLAAVLGIDEASLFQAAGMERPGAPTRRSLGESLAEIAPHTPSPAASDPGAVMERPLADSPESEPSTPGAGVDLRASKTVSTPERETVPLRSRRELRADAASTKAPVPVPEPGGAWAAVLNGLDRMTSRLRRRRQGHALVARPLAAPAPAPQRSYVEDPEQRLIYRFRSILLAVGLFFLALMFVWSLGELLDAVGASLDAVFGSD